MRTRPCLYPPQNAGYWGLESYEHGSRKQTSGGRTQQTAMAKATRIVADIDRGSQPLGVASLGDVLDAYLRRDAESWVDNQRVVATRELKKVLVPIRGWPASALHR